VPVTWADASAFLCLSYLPSYSMKSLTCLTFCKTYLLLPQTYHITTLCAQHSILAFTLQPAAANTCLLFCRTYSAYDVPACLLPPHHSSPTFQRLLFVTT